MDREQATKIMQSERLFGDDIAKAHNVAIRSMQTLDKIEQIINAPVYIQEDVLRYKMICEVIRNDKA